MLTIVELHWHGLNHTYLTIWSVCSCQWRDFIQITSSAWSPARFSTRTIAFHPVHATLGTEI